MSNNDVHQGNINSNACLSLPFPCQISKPPSLNTSFQSDQPLNKQPSFDLSVKEDIPPKTETKKIDMDVLRMLPSYIEKVSTNIQIIDAILSKGKTKTGEVSGTAGNLSTVNMNKNSNKSEPFSVIEEKDEDVLYKTKEKVNFNEYKKNSKVIKRESMPTVHPFVNNKISKVKTLDLSHIKTQSDQKIKAIDLSHCKTQSDQKIKIKANTFNSDASKSIHSNISNIYAKKALIESKTYTNNNNSTLKKNLNKVSRNTNFGDVGGLSHTLAGQKNKKMMNIPIKNSVILPNATNRPKIENKDQTLSSKKSAANLKAKFSFLTRKETSSTSSKKTKNTASKSSCNCTCTCKCHLNTSYNTNPCSCSPLTSSSTQFHQSKFSPVINSITIPQISKVKDISEIDSKSLCEMIYLFNEIPQLNTQTSHGNLQGLQSNLSSILKNYIESFSEDELPATDPEGGNLLSSKINISAYSSQNSSFANFSNERRLNELNKRRDDLKVGKVIKIQRKWRETKIKKMLYPLLCLDMKADDLYNFSFFYCNRTELLKLCKLNIYSALIKFGDQFRSILTLLNQASSLWKEFLKNPLLNQTKENLINDFAGSGYISNQSNLNKLPMGKFQEILSKIITNEIKLTLRTESTCSNSTATNVITETYIQTQ